MIISRAELIEAVEAGIAHAAYSNPSDASVAKLREVARTTERVAHNGYSVAYCGCPLVQAGLRTPAGDNIGPGVARQVWGFAPGYDEAMRAKLGPDAPRVVDVIG